MLQKSCPGPVGRSAAPPSALVLLQLNSPRLKLLPNLIRLCRQYCNSLCILFVAAFFLPLRAKVLPCHASDVQARRHVTSVDSAFGHMKGQIKDNAKVVCHF
jgi:hypothetical protein